MIVSFSGIRQFRRCQRQWCFHKLVASSQAKNNPLRRETYLLSQLQSLAAWRGGIVDHVISRRIIPALVKGWMIRRDTLLSYARSIFDERLSFALQNRVREEGMTQRKVGDSFSALMPIDYGEDVSEEEIAQVWAEVEKALLNLLDMNELFDLLRSSSKLIAQRPLILSHFQASFRAVPDVIAFFNHAPPLIVDWKVHVRGTQEYRLQLAAYAIALTRCKPHNDFPETLSGYSATDIRLLEVQLLTKHQRPYQMSEDDISEIDDYIAEAAMQMMLAVNGKSNGMIDPFDFSVTANPERCQWCGFRRICMEDPECQEPAQMTLL